jgi:hypothetical protein
LLLGEKDETAGRFRRSDGHRDIALPGLQRTNEARSPRIPMRALQAVCRVFVVSDTSPYLASDAQRAHPAIEEK